MCIEGSIGTEVFNLGTGTGYSVKEMVTAMEKASGRTIPSKVRNKRERKKGRGIGSFSGRSSSSGRYCECIL